VAGLRTLEIPEEFKPGCLAFSLATPNNLVISANPALVPGVGFAGMTE